MTKLGVDEESLLYFDNQTFIQSFVRALQNNSMPQFRDMFSRANMLMLDDVHCLLGRDRCQDEVLGIIEEINSLKIPIIATGKNHPQAMKDFNVSLRSKLCGGVAVRLYSPSVANEIEFINNLIIDRDIILTEEVKKWVCALFGNDFLQLKGAINRLELFSHAHNIPIIDGTAFDKIYKGEFYE